MAYDWNTRRSDEEGYAYQAFERFFGRAPTATELAQATGAYASGDRNRPNVAGGDAFVAQMFEQQNNTPESQYAKQQAGYKANAPQHYGTIDQLFQSSLGRAANQEERDHFGSLLASGQLDAYQLGQFINQLPESVRQQDAQFRQQLGSELQAGDSRYFNEQIMPGIQSQFARQGRTVEATGFQNALAREATGQNRQREQFLSNLTAQQYGGSQAAARENYLNTLGQYQGLQDYSRQRQASLQDQLTNRGYDIQNFSMQKQAYDDYLSRYGKRKADVFDYAGMVLGGIQTGTNIYNARNMGTGK